MSPVVSGMNRFGEWIGERTNPLLVKEVRQSLKSRQFVISFSLLLLICWLISAGGMLIGEELFETHSIPDGRNFFYAFFGVLSFAIFVVVPYQAFRSLLSERDQFTFELLSITTMKPGQIVRGKLSSSLVQTGLFYSAIAPFIAMTILLKGVSIPIIAFVLLLALLISAGLSILALTVGASCKNRGYQTWLTLLTLGSLLFFWSTTLPSILVLIGQAHFAFDEPEFWLITVVFLSFYVGYFVLALQLCVSFLTFEAENRSTNVRVCMICLFGLCFGWSISGIFFFPTHLVTGFGESLATFLAIHVFATCFLICFESDQLSHRVRREIGETRFRWLLIPLLPGGTRGLLFCYFLLALSFVVVSLFFTLQQNYILGLFLYTVIYVSVAALMNRLLQRFVPQYRPILGRVVTFLTCMVAAIAPYLVFFYSYHTEPPPIDCASNPFVTLEYLSMNGADSPVIIIILELAAVVAVALNVTPMRRVIMDTLRLNKEEAAL